MNWKAGDTTNNLSRPTAAPANFDQHSMYGLYLQGKNSIYFRRYVLAEEKLRACLEKDNNYAPALTDLSMLLYRKMNYAEALVYAKKALSINTYDAAANYYYGLINKKLGNKTDAIDGFDIATQSEEYRTPAFTELAKIYFSATDSSNEQAIHYAEKALLYNQQNTDAWQVLAAAYRLQNNKAKAINILQHIEEYDPLNCFIKFENWLWNKADASKKLTAGSLQNEMPDQTYLELALWYYGLGLTTECSDALQRYPASAEINYWLAYLNKNTPAEKNFYNKAISTKGQSAFPFRTESAFPLQWYANQTKDWQPAYNLALVQAACGNLPAAIKLMSQCGQQPGDASFYSARAKLNAADSINAEADIKKAIALDGQQWRFYKQLTELYNKENRFAEAMPVAQAYYQKNPAHYIMGMLLAKTFLFNRKYTEAAQVLDKIVVIPYEGATDGRRLYKEAHLMLCVEAMKTKNYKKAVTEINLSRQWPERLGVGKPYDEDIDERLENFLLYQSYLKLGDKNKSSVAMAAIKDNKMAAYKINDALSDWANGNAASLDKISFTDNDENSRVLGEWMKSK